MFNKQNKFNIKTIAVFACLILLFSFMLSFSVFNKTYNVDAVNTLVSTLKAENNLNDNNVLILKRNNGSNTSKTIKPISTTNNAQQSADPNQAYYVVISGFFPSTINFGTEISIVKSNDVYTIKFIDPEMPADPYCAEFYFNEGFTHKGFEFGYKDSDGEFVKTVEYKIETQKFTINGVSGDETSVTTEQIDPKFSGELVFKATYDEKEYSIDLYYQLGEYDEFEKITKEYFNRKHSLTISNYKPSSKPIGKSFANWVFDKNTAITDGYEVLHTYDIYGDDIIKVTKKEVKNNVEKIILDLTFVCEAPLSSNESNVYYVIKSVKGFGEFVQDDENPIITARWTKNYYAKIENSLTYWRNLVDKNTMTASESYKYYGASSSYAVYDEYSCGVEFCNNSDYAYPFMTTNNTAFYKQDDGSFPSAKDAECDEGSYYVYNYGHYITAWRITFAYENENYYFSYDDEFKIVKASISKKYEDISIDILEDYNFVHLAKKLDAFEDSNWSNVQQLTMVPIWDEVSIKIYDGYDRLDTIKFLDEYEIDTNVEIGYSAMCFSYKENDDDTLIAKEAVWNYLEIPRNTYDYDYEGNYSIDLYPVMVANIYKITLAEEHIKFTGNKYCLTENCDFEFNTQSGLPSFTGSTNNEITYLEYTKFDDDNYKFKEYNSTNWFWVDDYISKLKSYKEEYEEGVNGDGVDDFTIFKKVYYDANNISLSNSKTLESDTNVPFCIYLANGQNTGNLPSFTDEFYVLILWENVNANYVYFADDYSPSLNDEKLIGKVWHSDKTWFLSDGYNYSSLEITFNAIYEVRYSINMYYKLTENGICEDPIEAKYYSINDELDLTNSKYEPDDAPNNKIFGHWAFDIDKAKDAGYTVSESVDNSKIEVTKDATETEEAVKLVFECVINKDINGEYVYYVSSVKGYGILKQTKSTPIITAKWSNVYDLTIDNTNTYWKNEEDSFYGAYSSGENEGKKTTIQICDTSSYAYPFMKTGSTAFYKQSEWKGNKSGAAYCDENYYYVYNYGHYISAWKIYFTHGSKKYYVSEGWSFNNDSSTKLSLEYLSGYSFIDLAYYAEKVDDYLGLEWTIPKITMVPVWQEVNIYFTGDGYGFTDYLETDYQITSLNSSLGQSIMCYSYNTADEYALIANSGDWNYKEIPYNKYSYEYSEGEYSIKLYAVFVDNIYRITLNKETIKFNNNKYALISTGEFVFNSQKGLPKNVDGNEINSIEITYEDYSLANEYEFESFDKYFKNYTGIKWIDEYILKLKEYKDKYEKGIDGDGVDDFTIFKKVYYDADNISLSDSKTLKTDKIVQFYIFLANGQNTGNLPVFTADYYTLILWENANANYVYLTDKFDNSLNSEELIGKVWHSDKIWFLSDGYNYSSLEITFNAFYFRKNYSLDIRTVINENEITQIGYVKVDIIDSFAESESESISQAGSYVAIYSGTSMALYKYVEGSIVNNSDVIKNINSVGSKLDFYEGCGIKITVFDQSKDNDAVSSGKYINFIGYRFAKTLNQLPAEKPLFSNATNGGYSYSASAEDILTKGYSNGSTIVVNVCFEPIPYTIKIDIDNNKAGEFSVNSTSLNSGYYTSYTLTNIVIGETYTIDYYAFAGFKLQADAFVFNNVTVSDLVLLDYNDSSKIGQEYEISLTSDWLKEYFYSYYTGYSVEASELGNILIQTCPIQFNFGLKIYDETDTTQPKHIIETVSKGSLSLGETTASMSVEVSNYLINTEYPFYYYQLQNGTDYALLNSRLYFPNNYLTQTDNSYTEYDFLLITKPYNKVKITSYELAFMVNNFDNGKIISASDRNIYLMLEVRKLVTINIAVEKLQHDTNSTVRTTTLTQNTVNSAVVEVLPNAETVVDTKTYYKLANGSTSVVMYSYYGAVNAISSTYNSNRYSAVEYQTSSAMNVLQANNFTTYENCNFIIKYIPKSINVNIVYLKENNPISLSEVSNYVIDNNEYKPNAHSAYYLGDYVTYLVECCHNDYNISVIINSVSKGATNDNIRKIQCINNAELIDELGNKTYQDNRYLVSDLDYEAGKIDIIVNITIKNNSKITIKYQLENPMKKSADDYYGKFSVYENEVVKVCDVTTAEITVIEGRNVYVELNLQTGYVYKGIKHATYTIQNVQPVDGKILLLEDFDTLSHNGEYLIIIDKVNITAILNTGEAKSQYYINGKTVLNNLYVGSDIIFSAVETNEERLDCYYYTYTGANGDVKTVYLTNNGTLGGQPLMSFRITSSVLEEINNVFINFGVKTINRYKFDVEIFGEEFVQTNTLEFYYNGIDGDELGTYHDSGTEVTFAMETIVEGKYNINVLEQNLDIVTPGDVAVTLTEDYVLTITVTPKTFNVNFEEWLYSKLKEVQEEDPNMLTDATEYVNALIQVGQRYGDKATLEFTRVVNDRELATIHIKENDVEDNIVIKFNGETYNVYKELADGTLEDVNLQDYGVKLELTNAQTVKLSYITYNNIQIRFDYKLYKLLN